MTNMYKYVLLQPDTKQLSHYKRMFKQQTQRHNAQHPLTTSKRKTTKQKTTKQKTASTNKTIQHQQTTFVTQNQTILTKT